MASATVAQKRAAKKWRENNREHLAEKNKEWAAKNRDKRCASTRKWLAAHPTYLRGYRAANREQCNVRIKAWTQRNPERANANTHAYRARCKGASGSYTIKELNEQLERQEGFCYYCGELLYSTFDQKIHVDHKTPLSRGGSNYIENIALTCARCNWRKNNKMESEFIKYMEE